MRTLALLAGMTPDVTTLYYTLINTHIRTVLGAAHSARLYIYSVDLEEQLTRAKSHDWSGFAAEYIDAVSPLVHTKPHPRVQGVALGAILAHKIAPQLSASLPPDVPLLDVTRFLAKELKGRGVRRVGLIGPLITMTDVDPEFFIGKLKHKHEIEVLVPETEKELQEVNRGMMEEVVRGPAAVSEATRGMFRRAAEGLIKRGAEALVLGSTDLGFVLREEDFAKNGEKGVVVLDVAKVHARGLAEWMLEEE